MQSSKRSVKLLAITCVCLVVSACSGTRPAYLGTEQSALTLCPSTPNCVSSLTDEDSDHAISAIPFSDQSSMHSALIEAVNANASAELIVNTPNYVYAEYTSSLMKFVDDVEFLFSTSEKVIHVRSASRVGRSDFGVNRERIEQLRSQLTNK